jgi:hypothetical protein
LEAASNPTHAADIQAGLIGSSQQDGPVEEEDPSLAAASSAAIPATDMHTRLIGSAAGEVQTVVASDAQSMTREIELMRTELGGALRDGIAQMVAQITRLGDEQLQSRRMIANIASCQDGTSHGCCSGNGSTTIPSSTSADAGSGSRSCGKESKQGAVAAAAVAAETALTQTVSAAAVVPTDDWTCSEFFTEWARHRSQQACDAPNSVDKRKARPDVLGPAVHVTKMVAEGTAAAASSDKETDGVSGTVMGKMGAQDGPLLARIRELTEQVAEARRERDETLAMRAHERQETAPPVSHAVDAPHMRSRKRRALAESTSDCRPQTISGTPAASDASLNQMDSSAASAGVRRPESAAEAAAAAPGDASLDLNDSRAVYALAAVDGDWLEAPWKKASIYLQWKLSEFYATLPSLGSSIGARWNVHQAKDRVNVAFLRLRVQMAALAQAGEERAPLRADVDRLTATLAETADKWTEERALTAQHRDTIESLTQRLRESERVQQALKTKFLERETQLSKGRASVEQLLAQTEVYRTALAKAEKKRLARARKGQAKLKVEVTQRARRKRAGADERATECTPESPIDRDSPDHPDF